MSSNASRALQFSSTAAGKNVTRLSTTSVAGAGRLCLTSELQQSHGYLLAVYLTADCDHADTWTMLPNGSLASSQAPLAQCLDVCLYFNFFFFFKEKKIKKKEEEEEKEEDEEDEEEEGEIEQRDRSQTIKSRLDERPTTSLYDNYF